MLSTSVCPHCTHLNREPSPLYMYTKPRKFCLAVWHCVSTQIYECYTKQNLSGAPRNSSYLFVFRNPEDRLFLFSTASRHLTPHKFLQSTVNPFIFVFTASGSITCIFLYMKKYLFHFKSCASSLFSSSHLGFRDNSIYTQSFQIPVILFTKPLFYPLMGAILLSQIFLPSFLFCEVKRIRIMCCVPRVNENGPVIHKETEGNSFLIQLHIRSSKNVFRC